MGPIRKRLGRLDRQLGKAIGEHPDTLAQIALAVPYLGPITVAALTVYVDLAKASTPSSLWKYVGIHCASHERYVKGEKGGGQDPSDRALQHRVRDDEGAGLGVPRGLRPGEDEACAVG